MAATNRTRRITSINPALASLIARKEAEMKARALAPTTFVDFDHLTDAAKGQWLDLANAAQLALTTMNDLTSEQFSRGEDKAARLALADALSALGLLAGRS